MKLEKTVLLYSSSEIIMEGYRFLKEVYTSEEDLSRLEAGLANLQEFFELKELRVSQVDAFFKEAEFETVEVMDKVAEELRNLALDHVKEEVFDEAEEKIDEEYVWPQGKPEPLGAVYCWCDYLQNMIRFIRNELKNLKGEKK
jgi:hypothetical protein